MEKNKKITSFDIFVIITLIGIVPFLVHILPYKKDMSFVYDTEGLSLLYDYFNLIKVWVILIVALLIIINKTYVFISSGQYEIFKHRYSKGEYKFNKTQIFAAMIVLGVIIAFIFSPVKSVALKGTYERFESIWVHFSYVIIFFYFLDVFKKEGAFDIFSYAVLLSTFIVGGIGTLQYLGINIYGTSFIENLTAGGSELTLKIPGSFTTMYNTNPSGSYSLLMMHLVLVVFLLNKKKIVKIISVPCFIFVTISFANSLSEASYVAFVASIVSALILSLVVLFKKEKKIYFVGLLSLSLVCVIGGFVALSTTGMLSKGMQKFVGETETFSDWKQEGSDFYFYNNKDQYIKVSIIGNGYEVYENENLLYTDLVFDKSASQVQTTDFGTITLNEVVNDIDGKTYIDFNDYFYIRPTETPSIVSKVTLKDVEYVPFVGFEGHGAMFSNRGYIWSRSIPMIFDSHFIGYGSDAYFDMFPNKDVVGRAFCGFKETTNVDKPHNIYLGMIINNGILYLVGFFGIVFIRLIEKIKLLFNDGNVASLIIYISGLVAFLVNGLATDNIVVIMMLFWVYLSLDNEIFRSKYE